MYYKPMYPAFDSHVHISGRYDDLDGFMADCKRLYEETGVEGYATQCTSASKGSSGQCAAQLLAKSMYPGRLLAYGGFVYRLDGVPCDRAGMLAQAKDIYDAGFDGYKMLEGKPTTRKETGIPLDSEIYDDALSFVEEKGMHVLLHVADPYIFWDPALCPESAIKNGWSYVDGTYVEKEALHAEVDRMLAKHPKLKVTLAHFYFLSFDLDRLSRFLDRNPCVSLDVTPNPYMFYDFQKDLARSREFFIKYQDRILYGTDNMVHDGFDGKGGLSMAQKRSADIFRFFEQSDVYEPECWILGPLRGIGLSGEPLKKIYKLNYERLQGGARAMDAGKAADYCEKRLAAIERDALSAGGGADGVKRQISSVVERLRARR